MTAAPGSTGRGRLVPVPPDGGWGWVVMVGSFLNHVFVDGFVYAFGNLVDELMKNFDTDNATCAMIISLLTGMTLGCGPIASAICNKYGCRITTYIGTGIALIGCLMSVFATAIWQLIISVGIVMGFGFGLIYCPAIVIVTMYFEKRRSLATGVAVAGAGVGTMIFSPINGYLMRNYGYKSVFIAFSFILSLCAVCGYTFRPLKFIEVSDENEEKVEEEMKAVETEVVHPVPENAALLTVVRSPINRTRSSDSQGSVGKTSLAARSCHQLTTSDGESSQPRSRAGTVSEKEVGYLNRKDVFYTGSITNVAEFRDDPDKYRSTGSLHKKQSSVTGGLSVNRLDQVREISEDDSTDTTDNAEGGNMFKTISQMLSFELLLDPVFLLFAISNLLTSVGFNSPIYFLPTHAVKGVHVTGAQGDQVLQVFGLCNTIGRIVFGIIGDRELPLPNGLGKDTARNRLVMYNISLSICGILTIFCFYFDSFFSLCVYAGLFGFTIATYICLTSVILVDLLGLDKLTNAFGLLLLWQGVGTVFGPPLSGLLADYTGSYTMSFVFCGANLLVSGLMLFAIPYLRKKQNIEVAIEDQLQEKELKSIDN